MELIDKSAVVAEIDKQGTIRPELSWFTDILIQEILSLEVKDVDLEQEITDYINKRYHIRLDGTLERGNYPLTALGFTEIAKHFFELGLKQSSSDEYKIGESEIYLDDNDEEPPYHCEQWLDLSCKEYEIPHDKFEVGDKIEIVIRKIKKGETK